MSLAALNEGIAHARQCFEEGLIRLGFVENDHQQWRGTISHRGGDTEVKITLPANFPFQPPRVSPVDVDAVEWSWHRELDGALCLVAEDDHDNLWWVDATAFLEQAAAWFDASANDWADDRGELDLDRYFHPADDERLYIYPDLDEYVGASVRFTPHHVHVLGERHCVMHFKGDHRYFSKKSRQNHSVVSAYIADLGEIAGPVRSWADIAARVDPALELTGSIRRRAITILALIYTRGGTKGTVLLEVTPRDRGNIRVRRLRSAADTTAVRTARAGPRAAELADRKVAIVGIGAIGSFLADMLVRAGVGHLTLADGDLLQPGNLIRHLAGSNAVGLPKPLAVKEKLIDSHAVNPTHINTTAKVSTAIEAAELIDNHDFVVNATGDFCVTALLGAAADACGKNILSVALQNDGNTLRVDVIPPLSAAAPLPNSARVGHRSSSGEYFEPGCASPISPTPPHAVIEAAAVAARTTIGLLLSEPVNPSGEIRHLDCVTTDERKAYGGRHES